MRQKVAIRRNPRKKNHADVNNPHETRTMSPPSAMRKSFNVEVTPSHTPAASVSPHVYLFPLTSSQLCVPTHPALANLLF